MAAAMAARSSSVELDRAGDAKRPPAAAMPKAHARRARFPKTLTMNPSPLRSYGETCCCDDAEDGAARGACDGVAPLACDRATCGGALLASSRISSRAVPALSTM